MSRARDKTTFTLAALILWLYTIILLRDVIRPDLWVMINRIPAFLPGVWFGEIDRQHELMLSSKHWILCILAAFAGFLLRPAGVRSLIQLIPHFSFAISWLCCIPPCFLFAGFFSMLESGRLRVVFQWPLRFLAFVGTFTLELYCCHQWVYFKIYTLLEGHISYLGINLIGIPAAIATGWLFYLAHQCFWRLFMQLLPQKISK